MSGYMPHDAKTVTTAVLVALATLFLGLAFRGRRPSWCIRSFAWLLVITSTCSVERLTASEPAGIRTLLIVVTLLYGMKSVVTMEANAEKTVILSRWQWVGFAALWPGMRPSLFAKAGGPPQPGALRLAAWGCCLGGLGLALVAFAGLVWAEHETRMSDETAHLLATALLLPGLSLILHFGIFNVLAGLWRFAGVDTRPLFLHRSRQRLWMSFGAGDGIWLSPK